MRKHAVVIAGAGPTGLMLAGELALAGIDVAIVERRANQDVAGLRAGGLHARTIEVLDQRGIADRFLTAGQTAQVAGFSGLPLSIADFPTRHPYGLALRQGPIERILAEWVAERAVPIYRAREVTGFIQDDVGVEVMLSDGDSLHGEYLVGCDGGRSFIRKAAGIAFPGSDPTTSNIIAEVEMTSAPTVWGIHRNATGLHALSKLDDGRIGVVVTERSAEHTGEATLRDLSAALIAAYGTDYGVHSPTWLSRFTDMARQAEHYRKGRILLAGDAAHVHPPDGGQGLNTGVQDAVNLGWKLAQVVKCLSPSNLLDTYHAERHPVGARVLRNALASVAMRGADERTTALRGVLGELLAADAPRRQFAAMLSGLDIRYDLGAGHPLLGRRMPDLDVITADGQQRVFGLLHGARAALVTFNAPGSVEIAAWADRVQVIDADYTGGWDLPVLGAVAAPAAVLIRPDGHVAWVGDGTQTGLSAALTRWFGPPA